VNRYARRTVTLLVLVLTASSGWGRQAAQFTITPDTVLRDERFRVTLDGLKPGQEVTIQVDGNRGVWHSSATFRSDDHGRVDVADAMKLIWSATGARPPAGAPVQPWTFAAEADGRVIATQTIVRRAVAENVRLVPVRERGLVGMAYYPPGAGPHPAMIVLPGSEGGVPGPGAHAGGLASRGYVILALAFFNAEGLPPFLQNIPLEYFGTAVEWLKSQPSVDATRIGVLGGSRGGELALLLGATFPSEFRVVVANVPSNVVWPGLSDDSETPAWTLNGKPVPSVPSHFTGADLELSGRDRFLKRLKDTAAVARAEIPVERIDGPVLMFSGTDDQIWPSDIFATRVIERLKAHGFKHPVEHYSYENAGHQITRPFVPTADVREVRIHPVSKRPNVFGGTPEGQARANEDSWQKLLAFVDKYLRDEPRVERHTPDSSIRSGGAVHAASN
jgi:dienelactone hydrolase